MAAKDWRRMERETALDGLLAGALRYDWPRPSVAPAEAPGAAGSWEGLVGHEAAA